MDTAKSQTKKIRTSELILNSAKTLMLAEGFHGVSVDRIIEHVGVSKGTFFYHFPSKEKLAIKLLERFFVDRTTLLRHEIDKSLNTHDDPLTCINHCLDNICTSLENDRDGCSCMMAAFSYQLMAEIPEIKSQSEAALDTLESVISSLFEPFVRRLSPASMVSANDLARALFALIQGATIIARVTNSWGGLAPQLRPFKQYLAMLRQQYSHHNFTPALAEEVMAE